MKNISIPKFTPVQIDEMLKTGYFDFLDSGIRGSNSWVIGGKYT